LAIIAALMGQAAEVNEKPDEAERPLEDAMPSSHTVA
jgi:hypothetical protein